MEDATSFEDNKEWTDWLSQRKKNNVYRIKLRFFSSSKIKEIDSLIKKNYG